MSSTGAAPDSAPNTSSDPGSESRSPLSLVALRRSRPTWSRPAHDLAETVDALSAKLDVKSRAREQVAATKQRAADQAHAARTGATDVVNRGKAAATDENGKPTPAVLAGGGALVLLGIVVPALLGRRRRRRLTLVVPTR